MSENCGFKTIIASDPDYEKVVIEIYCDDKFVCLISQDKGPDRLELVFPEQTNLYITRSVYLDWFVDAVQKAKDRLLNG